MKTLILIIPLIIFLNVSLLSQGAGMLLNFDGVDDYVSVDSVSSEVAGTNFTVEAWFKSDSIFAAVFAFNPTGGLNRFLIYNQAIFEVNDGQNRFYYNQPVVNEWNYIAVTLDTLEELLSVYINGMKDITLSTTSRVDATDLASIGQEWDQGMLTSAFLNGSVDEVRVSDLALSLQEIRERMHRRLPDSNTGLVGYWRFDEGTGTVAGDSSGYGNDGSLVNGPVWDISTAPFGNGTANTQIISSIGQIYFDGTDIEMNFTSKTGTDTLVVTKINNEPGGMLPEKSLIKDVYWIVEKFGDGSFQTDLNFIFDSGILQTGQGIKLYSRPSGSDSGWNLIGEAAVITDTVVTFTGITEPGQFAVTVDTLTGINQEYVSEPYEYSLMQNYPNPFNPMTSIRYAVSSSQFVTLKVYDVLGREVATLVNEYKPAGNYHAEFSADNEKYSSGIYFYKLSAGSYSSVKKMVLMK